MKTIVYAIITLVLLSCDEPDNITVETPEPQAPIVVDGGILCSNSVSAHKVYSKVDRCPQGNLVLTGVLEDGVECATLLTECWVKKP